MVTYPWVQYLAQEKKSHTLRHPNTPLGWLKLTTDNTKYWQEVVETLLHAGGNAKWQNHSGRSGSSSLMKVIYTSTLCSSNSTPKNLSPQNGNMSTQDLFTVTLFIKAKEGKPTNEHQFKKHNKPWYSQTRDATQQ